ncbi:MAG TPA: DUF309 domain-containing protein [Isosphaeraceae bacterium]|jgi:hypothetical protein|nr:DUF309 domain-containing protein [Isosphaeraceae bacterium]
MPDDEPLPPYSYVPGGPWPHPISHPQGHWAGVRLPRPEPIADGRWVESPAYLRGATLFNAGFYWEAHEVWEGLWHAHGRRGPTADLLKALIKLAAAGVKVREGQPAGVATHARRAAALLENVRAQFGDRYLGLDLGALATCARALEANPPVATASAGATVARVLDFAIAPQ